MSRTWLATEPLRVYLYGLGVAALALVTSYGLVTGQQSALWGDLLVVALVPAVESARARVTPTQTQPPEGTPPNVHD